ncbi:hypothetical protein FLL45_13910 [Aliikangiella marina]|uniref:DUF4440 domain-containing protein n=1 Tax=Aliikangiella marina TaxID=1712262 RepID=A0A545T9Q8_9GAMM|nr:hypothetical protein [Aliikangiella marina]TQV73953.1 hypothetical protein FLL45_13910 [Aliikangiella marina]
MKTKYLLGLFVLLIFTSFVAADTVNPTEKSKTIKSQQAIQGGKSKLEAFSEPNRDSLLPEAEAVKGMNCSLASSKVDPKLLSFIKENAPRIQKDNLQLTNGYVSIFGGDIEIGAEEVLIWDRSVEKPTNFFGIRKEPGGEIIFRKIFISAVNSKWVCFENEMALTIKEKE